MQQSKALAILISIVMSSSSLAATHTKSANDDGQQLYNYLFPESLNQTQENSDDDQDETQKENSKESVSNWVDHIQGAYGKPRTAEEYEEPKNKGDIVTDDANKTAENHTKEPTRSNGNGNAQSPLDTLIEKAANGNVSTKLISSIIQVSSHYDMDYNENGRVGLMGIKNEWLDQNQDGLDPALNIEVGTKRIISLLSKYQDIKFALAAYRTSEAAIDKFGGIPNDPDVQKFINSVLKALSE